MDCDSLTVKCIASDTEVSSFRCEKLPEGFGGRKLELMSKASKIGGLLGAARHTVSQQNAEKEAGKCSKHCFD